MDEKPEPKISLPETIIIGLLLALLDLIDLIPFAGDITDAPAALLFLYYQIKGISGTVFAIAWVLDLIPILQEFPTRSIAWWISVFMDRHPSKATALIEAGGEIAQGKSGGATEAEGVIGKEAEAAKDMTTEAQKAEGVTVTQGETTVTQGEVTETTEGRTPSEGAEVKESTPESKTGGEAEEKRESVGEERAEEEVRPGEERTEGEKGGGEKKEEKDISATESEENPMEVEERKLLDEMPEAESEEDDNDEEEENDNENPKVQGPQAVEDTEEIKKRKAEQVKLRQQQLKKPGEITAEQDEDTLRKAA
jgi:hypothetical protein